MPCSNCLRSPVTMRLVTMSVLTISDIDVCLTVLFMANMWQRWDDGVIFKLGFCLVCVGFVTYSIGSLWFGPRQRNKVMPLCMDLMGSRPQDFMSDHWKMNKSGKYVDRSDPSFRDPASKKVMVEKSTSLFPSTTTRTRVGPTTFHELDANDGDDRQLCQTALYAWGLGYMWEAIAIKNSWNCCDMVHAIPFVRTGRFGFMSQPSPQDLGGILNANALFSFSVGTLELGFGSLLIAEDGWEVNTMVPLAFSTCSFIISLANVLFDFAATLAEVDCEERMAKSIQNRIAGTVATEKQDIVDERDRTLADIVEDYNGTAAKHDGVLIARSKKEEEAQQRYALRLDNLNRRELTELDIELNAFREKLQKQTDLLRGKHTRPQKNQSNTNQTQAIQNNLDSMDRKKQQVEENFRQALDAIDMDDDSAEAKSKEIMAKRAQSMRRIDEMKEQLLTGGGENNAVP